MLSGNQSQINFRHNRVQSNIVDSFNARVASQSALGLVSNNMSSTQKVQISAQKVQRNSMAVTKPKKG